MTFIGSGVVSLATFLLGESAAGDRRRSGSALSRDRTPAVQRADQFTVFDLAETLRSAGGATQPLDDVCRRSVSAGRVAARDFDFEPCLAYACARVAT